MWSLFCWLFYIVMFLCYKIQNLWVFFFQVMMNPRFWIWSQTFGPHCNSIAFSSMLNILLKIFKIASVGLAMQRMRQKYTFHLLSVGAIDMNFVSCTWQSWPQNTLTRSQEFRLYYMFPRLNIHIDKGLKKQFWGTMNYCTWRPQGTNVVPMY